MSALSGLVPPQARRSHRRVMGLDVSLTGTGVATSDGTVFTIKTRPADGDRRLLVIEQTLEPFVSGLDFVLMEDLPIHAKGSGLTAFAQGVVRKLLCAYDVPYGTVPPSTLKKYTTGDGGRTCGKPEMRAALEARGVHVDGDDNAVDAMALRLMGLDYIGTPVFHVPTEQRASLKHIKLPKGVRTPEVVRA